MLLCDAIQLFIDARRHLVAKQTIRNNRIYLRSLCEMLGDREIESITIEALRHWRAVLCDRNVKYEKNGLRKPERGKLSVYTIKGHVEAVRQLFNWLVMEEYLDKSPAKRLELPRLPEGPPRGIVDADLDKLIETARAEHAAFRRARNVALLLFIRDTGCRIGGASSLRFDQLDLDHGRAWVKEKGRGGGKTRAVFLKEEALTAMREWVALHPAFHPRRVLRKKNLPNRAREYVFVGERYPYEPLSTQSLYCVFKALKRKSGVTGRTNPHSLRHRRAQTLLLNGAPLGLVSRVLGHSNVGITDRVYGVYAVKELQEGFDRYA